MLNCENKKKRKGEENFRHLIYIHKYKVVSIAIQFARVNYICSCMSHGLIKYITGSYSDLNSSPSSYACMPPRTPILANVSATAT
jgi:hypothetical protein